MKRNHRCFSLTDLTSLPFERSGLSGGLDDMDLRIMVEENSDEQVLTRVAKRRIEDDEVKSSDDDQSPRTQLARGA